MGIIDIYIFARRYIEVIGVSTDFGWEVRSTKSARYGLGVR
jgi:hypothetical protein